MNKTSRKLTVLVCTHNRVDLLTRAIDSLNAAQRPSNWKVDLLVVANACSDGTSEYLESYLKDFDRTNGRLALRYLVEPRVGKSHAINAAIPAAKDSDVVAFVDDDHRVDTRYLVEICAAVETHPDATMFCGRIFPEWDGSEPAWVHDDGRYRIRPLPIPRSDNGSEERNLTLEDSTPGGGNLFLLGQVFDRVGHFSTDLGPHGHDLGGGEDTLFVNTALSGGERLMYMPGVIQHHYVDLSRLKLPYVLRKAYSRARSMALGLEELGGVPGYMWRKLLMYSLNIVFSLSRAKSRYFSVRVATTLGEISGFDEVNKRPSPRRDERRRSTIYGCAMLAICALTLIAFHGGNAPAMEALVAALLASGALTAMLGVKSIVNFTHTGPKLQEEVFSHYRAYSVFALLRLLFFVFVLLAFLTIPGALLYSLAGYVLDAPPNVPFAVLASGVSAFILTALQFSNQLLWRPATIAISYNYRLSGLYGFWNILNPLRLRFAKSALVFMALLMTTCITAVLFERGDVFAAFGTTGAVLCYVTL